MEASSIFTRKGDEMEAKKGDIIQITDKSDKWFPCLLVVSEVKSWGVQGYVTIPHSESVGNAYYRIEKGKYEVVGFAVIVAGTSDQNNKGEKK